MAKQKSWNNYYEIIDELGEGGNAKVYRVKSKEDNDIVKKNFNIIFLEIYILFKFI